MMVRFCGVKQSHVIMLVFILTSQVQESTAATLCATLSDSQLVRVGSAGKLMTALETSCKTHH